MINDWKDNKNWWMEDGKDSDPESIDSEHEDHLKYAGIYTEDELITIYKQKLYRLKALYNNQFKWLQHLLREKRRKYLYTKKFGEEVEMSKNLYDNLTALNNYQRPQGKENLLSYRLKKIKSKKDDSQNEDNLSTCTFKNDEIICSKLSLPLTKYCLNHILNDQRQVLYSKCNYQVKVCNEPILIFKNNGLCDYHIDMNKEFKSKLLKDSEVLTKEEQLDVVG